MSKRSQQVPKNNIVTVVPSGEPPHRLLPSAYEGTLPDFKGLYGEYHRLGMSSNSFTDQDLKAWANACRDSRPYENLSTEALCFWIGYFFPLYTQEGKDLVERLSKLV